MGIFFCGVVVGLEGCGCYSLKIGGVGGEVCGVSVYISVDSVVVE